MYFHSISPFFVKVMSSPGNVWGANRIQHICNTVIHKSPICGLFKLSKHYQRDRILQFKCLYGISKKVYYTSEFRFRGVFLDCELWYYYNIIIKEII